MAALSDVTTPIASYHHGDFPVVELQAMKRDRRVSVCIPARDEEATVVPIVESLRRGLVEGAGLVDELLVVDDRSSDTTALVAYGAGARVVSVPDVAGVRAGKGEAMRLGLAASTGDIIVFLDGDVENFGIHFVTGLLGPVFSNPETMLVKACYRRPIGDSPTGGGRVTELVARPALALLFPELRGVVQPLAGEVAVRREALEHIELADGYGVEVGMLIDISRRYGIGAIAQVDLDVRTHRNRPLSELAPQARDVLEVVLGRAGVRRR
ncbi:MAG: glucosyl-3-phosphoglycerate synthase [Acidimicrobiales bacterium]|jgi:glucosyl-3-phosphoglycerate synthase